MYIQKNSGFRFLFMSYLCCFFLFGQQSAQAQPLPREQLFWLEEYVGRTTHDVIEDARFQTLLDTAVPKISIDLGIPTPTKTPFSLRDAVSSVLTGPPDIIKRVNERIVISGCEYRYCLNKGFIWADPKNGSVIGALVHYKFGNDLNRFIKPGYREPSVLIYSSQISYNSLPKEFRLAISAWLQEKNVVLIEEWRFVGPDGKFIKIMDLTESQ